VKIAVLGAGAIGAYVGGMLYRTGADVSLIARGEHLRAIQKSGLRIITARHDITLRIPATDDPADVGPVDFVFLGVKAHQNLSIGAASAPLLGTGTVIVAAQNGVPWWYFHGSGGRHDGARVESVDPGGHVSRLFPPERAIGCVVYCSTEVTDLGVVMHLDGSKFPVGEPCGGRSERLQAFSELMRAAGFRAPMVRDIREQIWIKLMGNAVLNPVSALTGATLEEICRDPMTRQGVEVMMNEVLAVARAYGVTLRVSVAQRVAGAEAVGPHKTSMLQDLEAGKPLELDALVGAVIELGERADVPTPNLRLAHALVRLRATQPDRPGRRWSADAASVATRSPTRTA